MVLLLHVEQNKTIVEENKVIFQQRTEILERIKQLNNSTTEKSHIKEDEIIENLEEQLDDLTFSNPNSGHYTNIIKIDDQYF